MSLPLAYFLTWTCYGQRLHGDARGSVDKLHNRRGTPYLPADPGRREFERERLARTPFEMSPSMREVVADGLRSLCGERTWRMIACNVRSTHVHIVVNCRGDVSPERAMAQLKARATRDLRGAGLVSSDARLWTHHGSTRWINHTAGLYGAIAYVNDWQAGPNREMLEEHKRRVRETIAELKAWLATQALPESGRGVVVGESMDERVRRSSPGGLVGTPVDIRNEPRTK